MEVKYQHCQLVQEVPDALAVLFGVKREKVLVTAWEPGGADLAVCVPPHRFVVEFKASGATAQVAAAIDVLRRVTAAGDGGEIPLVAVTFMGKVGRQLCEEAGIGWLDLSGNAHIQAENLFIHVEGRPNRYKKAGRPANVFAPKSANLTRWLLMNNCRSWKQREIAKAVGMGEGYVSRITSYLEELDLLVRDKDNSICPRHAELLLKAWAEAYRFSVKDILIGHVATRSGEECQARVAQELERDGIRHAATGLGAAWLHNHFADFRLVVIYVERRPADELLDRIGFREEERGANTWLAVPSDPGVFLGASVREGVNCVHLLQAYLDLAWQPERSKEAKELLYRDFLNWSSNAKQPG